MIQIDGSYGEGGGQIVRTSVSLAAITGQAVEIQGVRGKRAKPGLQPQHLMAVRAAAELCRAELRGDAVGSVYLRFEPKEPVRAGEYRFEIGTAGSATLVAQTVLMPLLVAGGESRVAITGGTFNPMAPSSDYLELVYAPALRSMGAGLEVRSERAGFYPAGGGAVELRVSGGELRPARLVERRALRSLEAVVTVSRLPSTLGERAERAMRERLPSDAPLRVRTVEKESNGPGAAVSLIAEHEGGVAGFTGLGARGKPMERVAEEACEAYLAWREGVGAVDEHLADQLVLPAALARGASEWTTDVVSEHLRTVMWLVGQFLQIEAELGPVVRVAPRR